MMNAGEKNRGRNVGQGQMDDWESWVGRRTTSSAWLDPAQANRMAATLDRDPYFTSGMALPPAWHWLYFHDVAPAASLGGDGHPAVGVVMPPVPLPRRMWAGGRLDFPDTLPLGAEATRETTIHSVVPKAGRTGPLFFVEVEHEISVGTSRDAAVRETQTIVYRELPTGDSTVGADMEQAPTQADFTDRWHLDSTALFRYSALTFNGHRIHYDADYSRDVEGYPNLVIHGPLIATLLLDSLTTRGHEIATFTCRARSALFLPQPFTSNGRIRDDVVDLWATSESGALALQAQATVRKG